MFSNINKEHTAERDLRDLRQKGAATVYVAEFQQYSFRTGQNNNSLKAQFYKGLKDSIKDNMLYIDKQLRTLQAIITQVILIDN